MYLPAYLTYIFYSLLFVVSFVVWKGALNENIYIKEFAFGFTFVAMIIVTIIQSIKHGKIQIRVTWGDIFILGLTAVYMYFYIGTYNGFGFCITSDLFPVLLLYADAGYKRFSRFNSCIVPYSYTCYIAAYTVLRITIR